MLHRNSRQRTEIEPATVRDSDDPLAGSSIASRKPSSGPESGRRKPRLAEVTRERIAPLFREEGGFLCRCDRRPPPGLLVHLRRSTNARFALGYLKKARWNSACCSVAQLALRSHGRWPLQRR